MTNKLNVKYEELLAASQKAYDIYSADPNLKTPDRVNLRKVTQALADYYDRKKDTAKADMYRAKLKAF